MLKNVYIIGSKGIPAKYGGFETFVEKLTEYQKNKGIQYYVSCMKENSTKSGFNEDFFYYNQAICYNVKVPNMGPVKAIIYDILALNKAIRISRKNKDVKPVFYVLACRIGPFIGIFKREIEAIGGKLIVNPDGHEWKRAKWSYLVRKYWKFSERLMVKHADLLICDSKNIERYILNEYKNFSPRTTYIAYGTDLNKSNLNSSNKLVREWYKTKNVEENEYYLVVGRFVPENNYEVMISEFMRTDSKRSFVLVTNIEKNKFYNRLKKQTNFNKDKRIKFVGTVYDQELLKYIRENAFAYLHGHEVGGTNPSLLEALASTRLNLLLNVGFNQEVAENAAIYWDKNNLSSKINMVENFSEETILFKKNLSQKRIMDNYTWQGIVKLYENIFTGE
ncbi:beta 1-4 rhamnosyltransferase Cps2T [Enterococcus casseliflavus]|uniref:beta 1-4 rhamnosyltransferase Cps2T n=1 Tax=Enterococcus casseliflavus TaxID=37734 RepID=UPI0023D87A5A|nr:DUF1972 domain-containing protein [Enterococcus casseliflavus]WEI93498.1 DUF1972 domain-containing protein [Enterococcus casseliflavus]